MALENIFFYIFCTSHILIVLFLFSPSEETFCYFFCDIPLSFSLKFTSDLALSQTLYTPGSVSTEEGKSWKI